MPEEEQQQPAAEHHPAVSTLRTPPSPTPATDTTTTTTNVTSYPASSSTAARTMASAPAAAAATTDSVQSALSSLFARPPTAGAATRESASSSATTVGAAAPAIEPTTPGPMRQRALGPASAASSSSSGSLPASADASTGSTASASTPPTSLSSSSPSTRGDERLGVSSSWYTPLQESLPTMQASLPTGLSAAAAGKRPAHMCFADEDDALVGDVDSRLHLPRYPGHGGDFPMLEYSFARLSRRSFSTTSGDSRKCGLLSLPTEILMAIFEHTWSQKSLHELSLVCRALHASVAPFLYRFPRFIDTFSWAQFVLSITRQRNWRCGAYVQVLNLCITHGNSSVRTTSFQLHPVLSSLRLNPAAQARLPVELRLLETNTLPEDDAALADHFVPVVHRNTSIVGSASDAPAYKHQRHVVARTSSMPLDAMVVMESAGTGAAESATAVAADPRPREDVAVGQYNDRNMLLEFLESIEEHDERRRLAAMLLDHSLDEEGLLAFSVLRERMRRRSEHMRFMSRDAGRDIADDDFLLASALSAFESGRDREHWLFASAGQQEGAGLASNQPTPTATNGPSSPSSSHSFVNSVVSSSRTSSASMSGFRTSSSPTPSSSPPFFMSPAFPFSASSMGSDSSHREHDRSRLLRLFGSNRWPSSPSSFHSRDSNSRRSSQQSQRDGSNENVADNNAVPAALSNGRLSHRPGQQWRRWPVLSHRTDDATGVADAIAAATAAAGAENDVLVSMVETPPSVVASSSSSSSSSFTAAVPGQSATTESRQNANIPINGGNRVATATAAARPIPHFGRHGITAAAAAAAPILSTSPSSPRSSGGSNSSSSSSSATPSTIQVPASALLQIAERCPNLKTLSLCGALVLPDTLIAETGEFTSSLARAPQDYLTRVPVSPADGLARVLADCRLLVALDLSGCDWVTRDVVAVVVEKAHALRGLNLLRCRRVQPSSAAKLYWVLDAAELKPLVRSHLSDSA